MTGEFSGEYGGMPRHAHIEPTNYCNLACKSCIQPMLGKDKLGHLTPDNLKKMLDRLPSLDDISLIGLGEPLMNPELVELAGIIRGRGMALRTATNGMLLPKYKQLSDLLEKLDQLIVSVDSADPALFSRLRVNADLATVLAGVDRVAELITRDKLEAKLLFHTVVSAENIGVVEKIVPLAREHGVAGLQFVMAVQYVPSATGPGAGRDFHDRIEGMRYHDRSHEAELETRLKALAVENGIGKFSFFDSSAKAPDCWWPKRGIYITHDGRLTPCCLRMDPDEFSFGNILSAGFGDIRSGEPYGSFMRGFSAGEYPAVCAGCPG